jgi:hypothetical protein
MPAVWGLLASLVFIDQHRFEVAPPVISFGRGVPGGAPHDLKKPSSERPMHKLNTRNMLIFVLGLVLAVVLIGLGVAHVVQLKHRILPGSTNNALTGQP